jgi:hypothetical protein
MSDEAVMDVAPTPPKTEADLLREMTVTRASAIEAEEALRIAERRRADLVAEHDAKVGAARERLADAHSAFRSAQQALITRVAVDPVASIPAPAWPGVEAVKPVEVVELDDDDYDAVWRANQRKG